MKPALAALLVAALLAGCSVGGGDGSDKAGGSDAPVVLRMAYPYKPQEGQPDEPALRYFAERVRERSDGAMRVKITFNAAGESVPDIEVRIARMVREGRFDLGWLAARIWDQFGVKRFQALQAPFLITDYATLDRVAASPMADEMLAGLDPLGLTGLAVVPDLMRHPVGYTKALVSLDDYDGARFRYFPSNVTDKLLSALGAKPVLVSNRDAGLEIAHRRLDGAETATSRVPGAWTVTANVTFYGKANTVFADAEAFERLTPQQRDVLRKAGDDTTRHVAASPPSERDLARDFCTTGRIALATPAELRELRQAAQPVYDKLEGDSLTRSLIARIRALPSGAPAPEPVACGRTKETATGAPPRGSAGSFDGTYRWKITAEGARRVGVSKDDADIGSVVTMTLDGGRWLLGGDPHYAGTFAVKGDRLAFDWPSEGLVLTFGFKREKGGTLDMNPVLPMDPGDRMVWASSPWRRVGPPVRDVP